MMISGKWQPIGGIVQGATHIRKNSPCQDALYTKSTKNYTIACVADGHGSASCPYSSDGSEIAVKIAAELLESLLKKDQTKDLLEAHKDIWLPKQLESKWKLAAEAIHIENQREETFNPILYGTTLLALTATDTFVFAMQIGDGDILMVDTNQDARPLLATEEKLGEDTESLCQVDAWQYVRTQIIPWDEGTAMFLLSTDGYANSFADISGFIKTGSDFLKIWRNEGPEYIKKNIKSWLQTSSEKGSGDDIALAIVCKG